MELLQQITEFNKAFQKSYFDTDAGFFSILLPQQLNELKDLLSRVIEKYPDLKYQTEKNHFSIIDQELRIINEFNNKNAPPDMFTDYTKDKYLLQTKSNISTVCWNFIHSIWNYRESILHEEF